MRLEYANGATVDYLYNTPGRLLSIDNQTAGGQHEYAYTYDYVGNRTLMQVETGSRCELEELFV